MFFDAKLYNTMDKPWQTILQFLGETLPRLGFTSEKWEMVMDVGCGPGYLSKNHILPCFPNLRQMIAIDVTPGMIDEARYSHPDRSIIYELADIEDSSTVFQWFGQITKLISIHSFNWLKNQKRGFQIIYHLLAPGGEAALFFGLVAPYYVGMIETGRNPKFSSYAKNADYFIPESHHRKYGASHYEKMLTEIGFEVIHCKDEIKEDILSSDKEFRDIFYSICPIVRYLPDNLKEEFKEELFQNILKHNGRSEDGRPIYRCKMIEILIRKKK